MLLLILLPLRLQYDFFVTCWRCFFGGANTYGWNNLSFTTVIFTSICRPANAAVDAVAGSFLHVLFFLSRVHNPIVPHK
jgi:hypothetical protein